LSVVSLKPRSENDETTTYSNMMIQLKPRSSFSERGVFDFSKGDFSELTHCVSACAALPQRGLSIIPQFALISAGQYLNRISFIEQSVFCHH
jgi:hypothetical protein